MSRPRLLTNSGDRGSAELVLGWGPVAEMEIGSSMRCLPKTKATTSHHLNSNYYNKYLYDYMMGIPKSSSSQ